MSMIVNPAKLVASLRLQHRRITIRHLFLLLSLSAILSFLYYAHVQPSLVRDAIWSPETPEIWSERAAQVREAFRHAYHGYEQHAFPRDELKPLSNGSVDNFNGWGISAVDSLDTLLLMHLHDEYERALSMISNSNFSSPSNNAVPFFETVIRHLGGMLAAYALSGDNLLRDKADELAARLAPVFDTPTGMAAYAVDTYTGANFSYNPSLPEKRLGVLAEIASYQLEYAYLAKVTGKKEHIDRVTLITDVLYNANLTLFGGMYPTLWNLKNGTPTKPTSLTVGAFGDSGHEYTLKQFLLTARTDRRNLEMYLRFVSHVINNLLFVSPDRQLLYVTDATVWSRGATPSHRFEHLSCFFPGLLALGVHLLPLDRLDRLGINVAALADDLFPADQRAYARLAEFNLADLHLWAAEGLAQTCYLTYADQPTGLGPETVRMTVDRDGGARRWIDALRAWNKAESKWWKRLTGLANSRAPPGVGDIDPWTSPLSQNMTVEAASGPGSTRNKGQNLHGRDYLVKNAAFYLRPETVESLYILWRTTGDVKWRHRGWHIFQAIERYAKTDSGYASVDGVNTNYPKRQDSMPSYFLAETLKYLYLLFLEDDPFPLEKWVFNTEAHMFPVFEWSPAEREAYRIV